jgi:uncharacterized protein (TIGR02246 family)
LKRIARISGLSALALSLLVAACASSRETSVASGDDAIATLVRMMHQSAVDWNRGDLDAFVATYAPDAVFMGSPPTLGTDSIKVRYARTYFRDGKPKSQLAFDELTTRMLGPNHALMRGRCILTAPDNTKQYCRFTLIWERRPDGWKMIHDHSS